MEGLSVVCWHFHLILSSCLKKRCAFRSLFLYHSHCFLFSWTRRVVQIPAQVGGETHQKMEIFSELGGNRQRPGSCRCLSEPCGCVHFESHASWEQMEALLWCPSPVGSEILRKELSHAGCQSIHPTPSSLLEMNSNLLRKINLVLLWKQTPHCPMTLPGEIKVLFKN